MSASDATRGFAATVGANIRAGRQAKGLTQGAIARELDLSDGMAVSRWERGIHRPDMENQIKLAGLLFDGDVAALYAEPTPEKKAAA